jgi:ribosomal protein L40E
MIDGRRDFKGLRLAAAEMYIEWYLERDREHDMRDIPPERVAEALASYPSRKLSPGYYRWAEYLFWLRNVCSLDGCRLELLADEAEGLLVLAEAEREFRRTHAPCFKCGDFNDTGASYCRRCGVKFAE